MVINHFFEIFNPQNILTVSFKILAIFFSAFYLLYAIVLFKQTETMIKTLQVKRKEIFITVSKTQIIIAIILLLLAIFFV